MHHSVIKVAFVVKDYFLCVQPAYSMAAVPLEQRTRYLGWTSKRRQSLISEAARRNSGGINESGQASFKRQVENVHVLVYESL